MITRRIAGLFLIQLRLHTPFAVAIHTTNGYQQGKLCPPCPGAGNAKKVGGDGSGSSGGKLVRAEHTAPCRMGFIPEEWFTFLYPKTGVSGPYLLMLGIANYVASKEILVMEHEYYSGLSVALVIYLVTTNFGRQIGAILDKEVSVVEEEMQKGRKEETAMHNTIIKAGELAQAQAKAQEILMAAKKENISFQLEAEYRERLVKVYRAVRDRLLYHSKRSRTVNRIQQRWMIQWILKNVEKSITPDFQKQALSVAIRDLAAVASQVKK